MTAFDMLGIASFVLMTASFYFVRKLLSLFVAVGAGIVALCTVASWRVAAGVPGAEKIMLALGLALYCFGLLIVGVMLRRSVSLHLLACYAGGDSSASVATDIARRLEDAEHYGLVARNDEAYGLTLFGRCVASLVRVVHLMTRTAA
jgi:hypothetical protein